MSLAQRAQALKELCGFIERQELAIVHVQPVALADGMDQLQLAGPDDVSDLVRERQRVQQAAHDDGRDGQRQPGRTEPVDTAHHLVVVAPDPIGRGPRSF